MPKDCNGREIKVGDKVRHKHPPLPFDPGIDGKVRGRPEAVGSTDGTRRAPPSPERGATWAGDP